MRSIMDTSSSFCWMFFLLVSVIIATTINAAAFECDWGQDACPWPRDGQCDHEYAPSECGQGDCLDCDPLQVHHFDCAGCFAASNEGTEGFWCPYDGTCQSAPVDQSYFNLYWPIPLTKCVTQADWQMGAEMCQPTSDTNVYTDPLYDSMSWMYSLINIEDVWRQNITGKGVHVRINDDGVDATHAEFSTNFDIANSCETYLPGIMMDDDMYADDTVAGEPGLSFHGTAVASILAAHANNGECAVGIAHGATLSACTVLGLEDGAESLVRDLDYVDISSNSWGPLPCEYNFLSRRLRNLQDDTCIFKHQPPPYADGDRSPCQMCGINDGGDFDVTDEECQESIIYWCAMYYNEDTEACTEYLDIFVDCEYWALSPEYHENFVQAITQGRNGKGIIFVFPAGNEFEQGSDGNLDGMVNSRFTIAVGAVNPYGLRASYTSPGSPVLISAPGGDREWISNNIVAKPGGGCHDATMGTSFSTPIVSGVVALMLEVNPELTWRDVQGVLVASAQHNDPTHESWTTNGAGLHHSYVYGFGLVDAAAAVALARNWTNWMPEQQIMVESGAVDLAIADDPLQTTTSTITLSDENANVTVESVVVYLDLFHGTRGDLKIKLISPAGTESLLAPSKRPENTQLGGEQRWKLMTVRNWGESPVGEWTLTMVDEEEGIMEDCADFPFQFRQAAPEVVGPNVFYEVTCDSLANRTACSDGVINDPIVSQIFDTEYTGLSAAEACCACGGGVVAAGQTNMLKSWRMVVYGHSGDPSEGTAAPESTTDTPATPDTLTETIFYADYGARFKRILDVGCSGPSEETLLVACESGEIEITGVTDQSIVCFQPETFQTEGEAVACKISCVDELCDGIFVNRGASFTNLSDTAWGGVLFRCSSSDVNKINPLFLVSGADISGLNGTCSADSGDGQNMMLAELNVLCNGTLVNEDAYAECSLDTLSMNVDGRYACVTGSMCNDCDVSYDSVTVAGDLYRYHECIETSNGATVPMPASPVGELPAAGQYRAQFLVGSGYLYNEVSCSGGKTGIRAECVGGILELVESSPDTTCEVVGENVLECTENQDSPVNRFMDVAVYECTADDMIPTTNVEYYAADVSCFEENSASRWINLSVLCGEAGAQAFFSFDHFFECGEDNNFGQSTDDRFSCYSEVNVPAGDTPTTIPAVEAYTDWRWSFFSTESCHSYPASSPASDVAKAAGSLKSLAGKMATEHK